MACIALQNNVGLATTAVRYIGEAFDILADKLKFVTDGLQGATMMAAELGDALAFGPVSGLLNTLGGR